MSLRIDHFDDFIEIWSTKDPEGSGKLAAVNKMIIFVLKTRNCVSKTRNFVFK